MHQTARALLLATMLGLLVPAHAQVAAQTWPTKPVKLIVSFAPGAGPDIIARLVADQLARGWGHQVVVDNRPGGGNVIGAQAAARSAPDGYTFYFATAAALVTNPYMFKSLPYDPIRDFVPVAMIGKSYFFVVANPGVPAKTLPELIALEKAQPGKLIFATDGPKNFSGMVASWLNKLAGVQILQVPYATMPQGVQDTVAGRTQLAIVALSGAAALVKSGALRPLAVSSARRLPGYEEVPTVAETFPGFDFAGWFALVAPSGTPADVVQRVNRDVDRILKDPQLLRRLGEFGIYADGAESPEAMVVFVRRELASWGKVVREIGLEPE